MIRAELIYRATVTGDGGVVLSTRSRREGISTKTYPCQGKKESRGRLMIKLMTHVTVDTKGPASGTNEPSVLNFLNEETHSKSCPGTPEKRPTSSRRALLRKN